MSGNAQYTEYLDALSRPFRKRVKLEFLQPDETVAFALGGASQQNYMNRNTRAFLQSGSLTVALQNGQRRTASVTLANRDAAFDYAVNKLWFGQRVRLSMGLSLRDGTDFYLPQGVFYITNPSNLISSSERTISLSLVDKWSYLDGSLFGFLDAAYQVETGTNVFSAISSVLNLSRYTYEEAVNPTDRIDPVPPVFTTYYNGRTYSAANSDGSITTDIAMTDTPYEIREERGSSFANLILKLNTMLAGWIGYDQTGALRIEPSQDDISDADKPILYRFSQKNSVLRSMTETTSNQTVYNEVLVAGEGLSEEAVWARAQNIDPASDTNINLIGRKIFVSENADYWNTDQCAALARWMLKRKTILQKAVSVECAQMFHLKENSLIAVERTDKPGSPLERHLIQGYNIPIAEDENMTISCVSVNDIPDFTVTVGTSGGTE